MSAPMKLTKAQRWALLECRTADRFCDAGTKPKATPEEAKEEQEAAISWRPRFHVRYGEILCEDCLSSDPEEALEEAEQGLWSLDGIDPAEHGYVLADEGRHFVYLEDTAKEMKAKGVSRWLITQSRSYACDLYVHESEMSIFAPPPPAYNGPKVAAMVDHEDYREACNDCVGWCPHCDEFIVDACEPDASDRECPDCHQSHACGAEEALVRQWIDLE